ncbi:MAG: hypothetical protein JXM71_08780, partial [Spirochaetales bacterium]|nr:hypothetical protein [Spirochaetales bacterium]
DPATGTIVEWTNDSISSSVFCMGPSDELFWYNAAQSSSYEAESIYKTPMNGASTLAAGKSSKTTAGAAAGDFVHAYDLALSADGTRIYFTENAEGTVRNVLLSSGAITLMETASSPTAICALADPPGALYCTNDAIIQRLDSGSATSLQTGQSSAAIASGPDGSYYWFSSYDKRIYKTKSSTASVFAGNGEDLDFDDFDSMNALSLGLGSVNGLYMSSDETLYVSEEQGRVIAVKDGVATRVAGGTGGSSTSYTSGDGSIYTYGSFDNFPEEGEFGDALNTGTGKVYDVAVGSDGIVYIASEWPGFLRVTTEGLLDRLRVDLDGQTADAQPRHGVAVDGDGRVYLPVGYQILRLTPRL